MSDDAPTRYLEELDREELAAAIRLTASQGASDLALSHCTRLSVDVIRRILAGGGSYATTPRAATPAASESSRAGLKNFRGG